MDESLSTTTRTTRARSGTGIVVKTIRGIGWASLVVGLLILGFVAQQLFVTSWFADRNQVQLEEQAQEYFDATAAGVEEVPYITPLPGQQSRTGSGGSVPAETPNSIDGGPRATILVEPAPPVHQAFAILRIPKLDKLRDGWTVVEGVERSDLRNGAGHMTHTPVPGQPGNSVISGHRTTYGAPFHDFDKLEPGDVIEVETAIGMHTFVVREIVIVKPTELWVTAPRDGAWLTLTTCHPKFSSRQRLVVFAELVDGPNAAAILGA